MKISLFLKKMGRVLYKAKEYACSHALMVGFEFAKDELRNFFFHIVEGSFTEMARKSTLVDILDRKIRQGTGDLTIFIHGHSYRLCFDFFAFCTPGSEFQSHQIRGA